MTPNELSAKIAEIEKHAKFVNTPMEAIGDVARLAKAVTSLPPGILAAMCEVAVLLDSVPAAGVNMNELRERHGNALNAALAAFRALLTKEPA